VDLNVWGQALKVDWEVGAICRREAEMRDKLSKWISKNKKGHLASKHTLVPLDILNILLFPFS
jgi:hypothetical protein